MTIDFVVGSPVRENEFWFREEFIEDLRESLKHDNVLLTAPRRMGKTSVMYYLLDNPENETLAIHLNVEFVETPADFFINLIDAINEHQPDYVREYLSKSWKFLQKIWNHFEEISFFDFKINLRKAENWEKSWKERGRELIDHIENGKENILVIIDELPDMILNMKRTSPDELEAFLHYFRKVRLAPKSRMRWLVGGSVNIRGTLESMGLIKLINDFKTEILPPFTPDEVRKFMIENLSKRKVEYHSGVVVRTLELLGEPIPFFLQLLTQELYRHWKRTGRNPVTTKTLDQVFNKSLLGEQAKDKLQHFYGRIRNYYPEELKEPAYLILDHISLGKDGLSRKALLNLFRFEREKMSIPLSESQIKQDFDHLIYLLQSDFYIDELKSGAGYDFSSRLLKLWWRKFHGYARNID